MKKSDNSEWKSAKPEPVPVPDALHIALARYARAAKSLRAPFTASATVVDAATAEARECHVLAAKLNNRQRAAVNATLRQRDHVSLVELLRDISTWL